MIKVETYIPSSFIDQLREKLNEVGALTIDDIYDNCITTSKVTSYWRPLEGANPYLGELGVLDMEEEQKVEFCCNRDKMEQVVKIIKKVHPYEKPVIILIPLISI
ncbi:MAG: hypothetical protein FD141_1492 [Fusobacteria bacterium]|nr:MAG: hypothetical protein FD141_1492 [Fusobacteriota bacterium]KAF0230205.1 MAG: hypothetical protein FD182_595 [Fusobacteriota bacterium]